MFAYARCSRRPRSALMWRTTVPRVLVEHRPLEQYAQIVGGERWNPPLAAAVTASGLSGPTSRCLEPWKPSMRSWPMWTVAP